MRRQAGAPLFYFYKERLGTGSPPHPTRLRRPTFPPRGRLWVEKNLASQTSGPRKGRNKIQFVFCTDMCRAKNSSHPESASFAGAVRGASPNFGIPAQRVPKFLPFPARPAGGRAVTGVGSWAAGQAEKKRTPYRILQTRAGSPEGRNSPLWPSFPPFLGRNGGPRRVGALRGAAPRGLGKAPPTRRVRSTAIPPRQARAPPNGPLFFCAILCNFFAPTVYAGVQLWPRFPRG